MARLKLLLFCLFVGNILWAQNSDQDKLREAKVFFGHERYAEALSILSTSRQLSRVDEEGRFLIGVCQYQTNKLDEAYQTLAGLTQGNKPSYPECWLYMGKVRHAQHRFKEASDHYKTYLRTIFPNDPKRRMVIEEIRRCANGIELQFQSTNVFAENLGSEVNTAGDEFAPISSPNYADRLYFSAIRSQNTGGARDAYGNPDPRWGHFYSDMFSTRVIRGLWSDVKPMHYLLNSPKHEILLGIDESGQALYYFQGWDLQRGDVIVDTFQRMENRTLSSTPLPAPLRTHEGDNYPVFYRDTLMIFASNRRGGYGGWDLYKVSKRDGRWLLPENLGPTINTAYDETTPFLANDGQTLYFSSNDSKKSIGGLDVFKSTFVPQKNIWSPPKSVGMPINSASDDAFFKIAQDGFTAYFASSRKEGYGERDIYIAFFQDFLIEMEYPPNYHQDQAANNRVQPPQVEPEYIPDFPPPVEPAKPAESNPLAENDFDRPVSPPVNPPLNTQPAPVNTSIGATPKAEPEPVPVSPYAPIEVDGKSILPTEYDRLDQLGDKLIGRRDLRLVITAYHPAGGPTGIALFEAIEKAEAVGQYLLRKGVAKEQLFMRGALLEGDEQLQKRVEVAFTTVDGASPGDDLPALGGQPELHQPLTINAPLHYKVQVASAKRAIDSDYLEGFSAPMIEKTPDFEYYRYTLGAFTDRSAAESFRQKMKANGRGSAYLATYKLGWRMAR
ncbi:PD40 domain-containing protein [Flavilitoribacter nigricans]|uniref:SPOR domain-containing protein n=1 Tax=Flavilitoribacter nigricans (strain ATCC 23147 / DSM 23189 / NBRC 102662 / NCIMB 1420 / SS-2) TaxID=1122177 RepID=A0A2D0NHS9_FLAN2|nr:PD40 domain-containing protein [Flavilitoribacter nigricans]PHN08062.1 hypothetical protein CRP01_03335 [Flavilitoribacter nigricans DSM 23189 = NBRC 102662]